MAKSREEQVRAVIAQYLRFANESFRAAQTEERAFGQIAHCNAAILQMAGGLRLYLVLLMSQNQLASWSNHEDCLKLGQKIREQKEDGNDFRLNEIRNLLLNPDSWLAKFLDILASMETDKSISDNLKTDKSESLIASSGNNETSPLHWTEIATEDLIVLRDEMVAMHDRHLESALEN